MKIKSILLYSHDGRLRELNFKLNGLNVITGHSSTGKSALSDIIEYCMGRSTFNVPEGIIRDKVSWYGVIYKFDTDELLVAKPGPTENNNSCSLVMHRRGNDLQAPDYEDLEPNSDDVSIVRLLSTLVGIPENKTDVPIDQSRTSFKANIKHTYYYLFQKQGLITNKDQLFYRQNEPHQLQTIIDTLPILLGVSSDKKYTLEASLRDTRRDFRLVMKRLTAARDFVDSTLERGLGLLSEARLVGILDGSGDFSDRKSLIDALKNVGAWKPGELIETGSAQISQLESKISDLRRQRQAYEQRLETAVEFSKNSGGYQHEAAEQQTRLASIRALPKCNDTGEWQWPFTEKNLGMETPIAKALLEELASLDKELEIVVGEQPKLDAFIVEQNEEIKSLNGEVRKLEIELSSAIAADEVFAELKSRNYAASKVVGRVSLFLEDVKVQQDISQLEAEVRRLTARIEALENDIGADSVEDRITSVMNNISSRMTNYAKMLNAEFSQYPFRFDYKKLTVAIDRPERPVTMGRTGGGENHLAHHLSALLSIHQFAQQNNRPIPRFLLLDQPTQVYFPSEKVYQDVDGSIEKTKRDADVEAVHRLFAMLYKYSKDDCPGFQIIVTEHANLDEDWFQDSLVEPPWTKPPALVPDDWPEIS